MGLFDKVKSNLDTTIEKERKSLERYLKKHPN